jgi:ATP-dependent DNA helicase RecG
MAGLMLTFRANPAHLRSATAETNGGATPLTTQETTQETAQETTQERILALLRIKPSLTRKSLAITLGLSDSGVKYHLEKLKATGIIRHAGPTKSGHWDVFK